MRREKLNILRFLRENGAAVYDRGYLKSGEDHVIDIGASQYIGELFEEGMVTATGQVGWMLTERGEKYIRMIEMVELVQTNRRADCTNVPIIDGDWA